MGNNYFKFKQFTIYQDGTAMKVCTDACLFGAYTAAMVKKLEGKNENGEHSADNRSGETISPLENESPRSIIGHQTSNAHLTSNSPHPTSNLLDIGTGTGLLSLMVAQKTACFIDAVEIDEIAAARAKQNIAASPWAERITVHQTSVQSFAQQKHELTNNAKVQIIQPSFSYDYIISNPPFFNNALLSNSEQKNAAKHTTTLSFDALASTIDLLLSQNGKAFIMLPPTEMLAFTKTLELNRLYPEHTVNVHQTPVHQAFRNITVFCRNQVQSVQTGKIVIKETADKYSQSFIELLKDYYLYL
jgi:tRNA1Val (adenine37-N6)-methyltransferase